MHDAFARCEPLHIAIAKARRRARGVGVVDTAFTHNRDGLKPAVGMCGEAGHGLAVVHAPAVFAREVLPHTAARQGGLRAHGFVARWVGIVVMHAEQEGIHGLPRE